MSRRTARKDFLTEEEIVQLMQDLSSENSDSKNDDENDLESDISLYANDYVAIFDFEIQQIENQHNTSSSSFDYEADVSNTVCTTNNTAQEVKEVIRENNRGLKSSRGRRRNQQTNSDENNSYEEIATDGTLWKNISQNISGRGPMHNVLREIVAPHLTLKEKLVLKIQVVLGAFFYLKKC